MNDFLVDGFDELLIVILVNGFIIDFLVYDFLVVGWFSCLVGVLFFFFSRSFNFDFLVFVDLYVIRLKKFGWRVLYIKNVDLLCIK